MKATQTPGGLIVISSDEVKHRADDKPKQKTYFVSTYQRFEEANRHMMAVVKDGGEIVSMCRHGVPTCGIVPEKYGYVITYFNHRFIEVEVKT